MGIPHKSSFPQVPVSWLLIVNTSPIETPTNTLLAIPNGMAPVAPFTRYLGWHCTVRLEGTPLKVIVWAVTGLGASVRVILRHSQLANIVRVDLMRCFSVHQ